MARAQFTIIRDDLGYPMKIGTSTNPQSAISRANEELRRTRGGTVEVVGSRFHLVGTLRGNILRWTEQGSGKVVKAFDVTKTANPWWN